MARDVFPSKLADILSYSVSSDTSSEHTYPRSDEDLMCKPKIYMRIPNKLKNVKVSSYEISNAQVAVPDYFVSNHLGAEAPKKQFRSFIIFIAVEENIVYNPDGTRILQFGLDSTTLTTHATVSDPPNDPKQIFINVNSNLWSNNPWRLAVWLSKQLTDKYQTRYYGTDENDWTAEKIQVEFINGIFIFSNVTDKTLFFPKVPNLFTNKPPAGDFILPYTEKSQLLYNHDPIYNSSINSIGGTIGYSFTLNIDMGVYAHDVQDPTYSPTRTCSFIKIPPDNQYRSQSQITFKANGDMVFKLGLTENNGLYPRSTFENLRNWFNIPLFQYRASVTQRRGTYIDGARTIDEFLQFMVVEIIKGIESIGGVNNSFTSFNLIRKGIYIVPEFTLTIPPPAGEMYFIAVQMNKEYGKYYPVATGLEAALGWVNYSSAGGSYVVAGNHLPQNNAYPSIPWRFPPSRHMFIRCKELSSVSSVDIGQLGMYHVDYDTSNPLDTVQHELDRDRIFSAYVYKIIDNVKPIESVDSLRTHSTHKTRIIINKGTNLYSQILNRTGEPYLIFELIDDTGIDHSYINGTEWSFTIKFYIS